VPFLARYLFGEALSVSSDASLADAVWGAAVAVAIQDNLPASTRDLLAGPSAPQADRTHGIGG